MGDGQLYDVASLTEGIARQERGFPRHQLSGAGVAAPRQRSQAPAAGAGAAALGGACGGRLRHAVEVVLGRGPEALVVRVVRAVDVYKISIAANQQDRPLATVLGLDGQAGALLAERLEAVVIEFLCSCESSNVSVNLEVSKTRYFVGLVILDEALADDATIRPQLVSVQADNSRHHLCLDSLHNYVIIKGCCGLAFGAEHCSRRRCDNCFVLVAMRWPLSPSAHGLRQAPKADR
mmetsp:Transcript_1251/g.5134  ORF Transcript_1251/g.5134 Transcript_1251/m.5134 type:complete len:235 (-) Transcript_1251:33-737(-)